MLRWDLETKANTTLLRWKDRRGAGSPTVGRSFDEELSLFERQARDEAERRTRDAASQTHVFRTVS